MSTCLHLDHEGLDVAVELCFVVVAGGRQREEVLGCGGREMQTSCASTSVPSSRRLGSSAACIVCDRSPAATASDPPVRGASSQNSSSLMSPRLVCSVTDWGNIRGGGGTGERRQAAAAAAPPTRAEAGGGGCNSRRCDYSSAGCQLQPAQQPLGGGGNASGAPRSFEAAARGSQDLNKPLTILPERSCLPLSRPAARLLSAAPSPACCCNTPRMLLTRLAIQMGRDDGHKRA